MKNFLEELKRRNVIKAAIAYVVVAWVVVQVISILAPLFNVPDGVTRFLMVLLFLGFPIWVVFSWVYEATESGVKRTSKVKPGESMSPVINKRLNILIVIMLGVAIAINLLMGNNSFAADPASEETQIMEASIAVLPFDSDSPGEDSEGFSRAMTTDVQNHLARLSKMTVISNTTTERYRDSVKTVPEILSDLKVNYVLEGKVSIYEGQVQVNVQLIDANDHPVWSEVYREEFRDIFSIREKIAKSVADKLSVAISVEEEAALEQIPTKSMEAYRLVYRVERMFNAGEINENPEAIQELLDQAIDLDSTYADAYANKGILVEQNPLLYWPNSDRIADSLYDRALYFDPNNVSALTLKAMNQLKEGRNLREVKKKMEELLSKSPNHPMTYWLATAYYSQPGNLDTKKVLQYYRKLKQLEPFSEEINEALYECLNLNGKYEEAEAMLSDPFLAFGKDERTYNQIFWKGIAKEDPLYFGKGLIEQFEKQLDNPFWNWQVSIYFDWFLNDDEQQLYYAKKAYDLEPSNLDYLHNYIIAVAENGKVEFGVEFLDSLDLINLGMGSSYKDWCYAYLYYEQREFETSLKYILNISDPESEPIYMFIYTQLGEEEIMEKHLKEHGWGINSEDMAIYYAIKGIRDSMYYSLSKVKKKYAGLINSRFEFDPYRKEEQYRNFLRNNYIPVPGEYDPSELEIRSPRAVE